MTTVAFISALVFFVGVFVGAWIATCGETITTDEARSIRFFTFFVCLLLCLVLVAVWGWGVVWGWFA